MTDLGEQVVLATVCLLPDVTTAQGFTPHNLCWEKVAQLRKEERQGHASLERLVLLFPPSNERLSRKFDYAKTDNRFWYFTPGSGGTWHPAMGWGVSWGGF